MLHILIFVFYVGTSPTPTVTIVQEFNTARACQNAQSRLRLDLVSKFPDGEDHGGCFEKNL